MSVSQNIERIRKANGIRQIDIAEKLGITAAAVSATEKNAPNARLSTLARIASAMGASLIDLMLDFDTPGYDENGKYDDGEIRNWKQSEWVRLFDRLNADGVEEAKRYIAELSSMEQYQSKQKSVADDMYEEYLREMGL